MTSLGPYPEYKESGSEWLGQLPSHWDVVPSKWLFSSRAGRPAPGAVHLMASQKYGVISQAKFMAEKDQRVVQTIVGGENMKRICINDFLIHLRSFQGGIEWSANEGKVSPAYTVLRPNNGVHPPFFYYLLKSDGYIQELRATTNQLRDGQSMNYSQFAMVPLIKVPWDEQVAIASFLDRETAQIDALIGKQERLIELLAEKRQAIITNAVTKGLDPTAPTKPSGVPWLGDVAAHWRLVDLKHVIQVLTGFPFRSEDFSDAPEDVPLLRGININPGKTNWTDTVRIDVSQAKEYADYSLELGDLVLGLDRPIVSDGVRVCAIGPDDLPSILLQRVARIRSNGSVDQEFVAHLLSSSIFSNYLEPLFTGVSVPHMSPGQLGEFKIALPPLDEQESVSLYLKDTLKKLDDLADRAGSVISFLKERRTALISAAVTGKIDVQAEGTAN